MLYKALDYFCPSVSPVTQWHPQIQDPTLADAILDRIVHDALRLSLKGESMRKLTSKLPTQKQETDS